MKARFRAEAFDTKVRCFGVTLSDLRGHDVRAGKDFFPKCASKTVLTTPLRVTDRLLFLFLFLGFILRRLSLNEHADAEIITKMDSWDNAKGRSSEEYRAYDWTVDG